MLKKIIVAALLLSVCTVFTGCVKKNLKKTPVAAPASSGVKCECIPAKSSEVKSVDVPIPEAMVVETKAPEIKPFDPKEEAKIAPFSLLKPAKWDEIDGINQADLSLSWAAWLQSCAALGSKPMWQTACAAATVLNAGAANKPNVDAIQSYYKQNFNVYKTTNADGTDSGMITGYYEPLLKGSHKKSAKYPNPLYATPNDLVTVELDSLHPELKYKRLRGRLVGNKLVPYYNRADIEAEPSPIKGRELIYIDDIIDVFYLQIQGSGLVQLENGTQVHVGYADQNGLMYNSIGRLLIERGEITYANASMNGIKNWAKNNPAKLRELLNSNPSYVFFRELPAGLPGPLGALGVPILAEQSVAVDAKYIPLGAPIFLSTTEPNSAKPLKRLMMAQDTGGAIKGGVRADFFWGAGTEAGGRAGSMKQSGKIWVLLPKDFVLK